MTVEQKIAELKDKLDNVKKHRDQEFKIYDAACTQVRELETAIRVLEAQ